MKQLKKLGLAAFVALAIGMVAVPVIAAQQTITQEGSFDRTIRTQINDNFNELYGAVKSGEVVAATNTLTSDECGKTMTLAHATEFVTTLPAPSLGCKFKIIVGLAPASASYTIVTASSANIIYGGVTSNEIDDTTDSNAAASDGSDLITFADGQAVKGDWVELWSDGTSWYVSGNSKVRAGITFGQT